MISPSAPTISHLLFADDTVLFCRALEGQLDEIHNILEAYARASGQVVNFLKSSMVVSGAIRDEHKRMLAARLGVRLVTSHDRYLGLPAVVGRSRSALFHNIRDRFWGRINGWNGKLLSQAGKGVLIKSVLQSLPTYAMSCFRFPEKLLKDLETAMRDFWWHNRGEKRTHWVAWRKLCRPLSQGGLGFRDLKAFNEALLAKQGWRILTQPTSLLSRVLKARYFPQCSFWEAAVGSRPSLTWRSILIGRGVLKVGCREQTEQGTTGGSRLVWRPSKKGNFSVKSAYVVSLSLEDREVASTSRRFPLLADDCEQFWSRMWSLVVPPKIRVQAWRFCYEAVPTMGNIAKRREGVETRCVLCDHEVETLQHILLECPFARLVWALSNIPWRFIDSWTTGAGGWLSLVLKNLDKMDGARFLTLCWALWQNRNMKRMQGVTQDPQRVCNDALFMLQQYADVRVKLKLGLLYR